MKLRSRAMLWILLATSIVAGIWWLLYVPYRPDRVFSAIPVNATVIGVQQDLAGQWDALTRNPMVLESVRAAGGQETNFTAFATNPVARKWIQKLASDQSVIAYVPSLGETRKPALLFVSWIGRQSRLLRWQAAWIKSRDVRPLQLDAGRLTIWRIRTDLEKSGNHLSVALSEGLILGCLSSDPLAVKSVLETAEGYPGRLSVAGGGMPARIRERLGTPLRPLWGWIRTPGDPVAYQLALDDNRLSLTVTGTHTLPPAHALRLSPGIKIADNLTATTSDLVAVLPVSWVHAITPSDASPLWMQAIHDLTDTNNLAADALVFAALLDQDHNGRLRGPLGSALRGFVKGVKTPTLLVGIQVGSRDEAESRIKSVLNPLNSRYNLSLTTRIDDAEGEPTVTLIEESRKNFYGSFEPGERVAFTMADDWLVIASHASTLRKVLRTPNTGLSQVPLTTPEPEALARAKLEGLGSTVKTATGVLKLATLFMSSDEMAHTRETLDRVKTWAEALRPWGTAEAVMSTSGTTYRVTLKVGKQ